MRLNHSFHFMKVKSGSEHLPTSPLGCSDTDHQENRASQQRNRMKAWSSIVSGSTRVTQKKVGVIWIITNTKHTRMHGEHLAVIRLEIKEVTETNLRLGIVFKKNNNTCNFAFLWAPKRPNASWHFGGLEGLCVFTLMNKSFPPAIIAAAPEADICKWSTVKENNCIFYTRDMREQIELRANTARDTGQTPQHQIHEFHLWHYNIYN